MSNTFQESIRKFGLRRKEQLNEAKQYEEDAFYYDMLRKIWIKRLHSFQMIEESRKGFIAAMSEKAQKQQIS